MKLDKKKSEIQKIALKYWLSNNKIGTCEIITGLGKTFLFLDALYTMPKNNDIHLFLAEATDRKRDLDKDIQNYNKLFKVNVYKDYNLEFYCYQTVYKWRDKKFGLVGCDEIHDSLTPSYSMFYFKNTYKAILGLSATINTKIKYEKEGYTKGDLINKIAPIVYTYTVDEGQSDGTSRLLDLYIIQHKLDNTLKNIKAGSKTKVFFQTEEAAYNYWDKEHKRSWFIEDPELKNLKIRITSTKRSNILYNLESKVSIVKKLINNIKGKSILFGNSLTSLLKVTPNVVSSKNSEDKNKKIRDSFENNKTSLIGSFKKLKQGANLSDLDNCIMMSYYSTEGDAIQRWGRLRNNGKIGNVFIFVTMGTQEEVWLTKMLTNINNINTIYCPNVEFAIKKYNERN